MKLYKVKKIVSGIFIYLELLIVAVIVIYPLLWVVGSSLNPQNGIARSSMIPDNPTLANYVRLFQKTHYLAWYGNTLFVAVFTTIFSIVLHTMTAFVFARFRFRGRKMGLLFVMILQMFPSFMGLTALYMVALNFGMLNNLFMLIIVYVAGGIPQNIWLVRGYMLNIPKSMDEAASIDGVTKLQLFFKIILPLSLPIIFFIAVTSFMGPWMDYMLPRYLINMSEKRTLAIGLFDLINGTTQDFTAFCAGSVLVAIPITILYMVFQRFLLEGLMAGANKGE
ncbi:MAG: sugar ABC transporter permease [Treponema sp.]|jgi:arabinogalactan oligomer/maltooligosaccharide transport system permease protein|nr:sugar ABC transporter permease [Treponema sp.]MDR2608627.1 sugar ABC transporter permease [Treponema sp.]